MDSSVGGLSGTTWGGVQPVAWRRLLSERTGVGVMCPAAWLSLASGGEMGRLLAGGGMIIFTLVAASCFPPKHVSTKS